MKMFFRSLAVLLTAILFTVVFHRQAPGLNLLIFEVLVVGGFLALKVFKPSSVLHFIILAGMGLSLLATVVVHSVLAYLVNAAMFLVFAGSVAYPESRGLPATILSSAFNTLTAPFRFLGSLFPKGKEKGGAERWVTSLIFIFLSIIILLVFVLLYSASSPWFNNILGSLGDVLRRALESIARWLDEDMVFLLVFGGIIGSVLWFARSTGWIIRMDKESSEDLVAPDDGTPSEHTGQERVLAMGLLIALNALLLLLNVLDVRWVWLGFEWNGDYLRQFVHEGTWLLILSIVFSVIIVLYFFRGEFNFSQRAQWVRRLAFIFLAQNAFLVLSVGMRNYWYIHYFALAYKRIAVILFLLLALYGLYTIVIKVKEKRSLHYLLRKNSLALMILLVLASLLNWDNLIARYNVRHADRAFLHLDFMATLPDRSLPLLDIPPAALERIHARQVVLFPFTGRNYYMSPEDYTLAIARRKTEFIERWESKGWLSWNYAEYRAYRRLMNTSGSR